jgi:hypothetical protein
VTEKIFGVVKVGHGLLKRIARELRGTRQPCDLYRIFRFPQLQRRLGVKSV